MDAETKELRKDEFRLSTEQQAEIGDILLSARAVSRQMINDAQTKADAILQSANAEAERLVREAEEKAAETLRAAEARALEIAPAEEPAETPAASALSEEMQDYVVRCVGDCFAKLRQQQLDTVDYLNEQWQGFLSGLSLPELPTPVTAQTEETGREVSRQDIEQRVSAIAKELMEIIGK